MPPKTTKVKLVCATCQGEGVHMDECVDKDKFPTEIEQKGTEITRAFLNGDVFINHEEGSTHTFMSPSVAGFGQGRVLLPHGTGSKKTWQRFPTAFETTVFAPTARSTPRRSLSFDGNSTLTEANENNDSITAALVDSNSTAALLKDVPTFDGNPRNYATWLAKMELIRPCVKDEFFLRLIKQKLNTDVTMFIAGIGTKADTTESILKCLGDQYDEYAMPMFSHTKFSSLRQTSKDLGKHHAEIYQLVRGMGRKLTTNEDLLKSGYIKSLTNKSLRAKLMRMTTQKGKDCTLEMLMERAVEEERIELMSNEENQFHTATAAPVVQANVIEVKATAAPVEVKDQSKRYQQRPPYKPNNSRPGEYCAIHQTSRHDISVCRNVRDKICRFCKIEFAEGQYENHMTKCTGRRCFNCNKIGHMSKACVQPKRAYRPDSKDSNKRTKVDHTPDVKVQKPAALTSEQVEMVNAVAARFPIRAVDKNVSVQTKTGE